MSYDFLLLPRDPGQSWDQVMEANERLALEEGDRALSPAARTRLKQIADRLQAHDPQLERLTTERYIELTRIDDSGIQLSLFSGQLAVSVAYWHTGSAARATMQIVWPYLAILEQETGWEVHDRQLGRSLDRGHDLVEVTGWYADLSAPLHRRFPQALQLADQSGWRWRSPGAKRGANGGRRQATPRDVWRRRVQLAGGSQCGRGIMIPQVLDGISLNPFRGGEAVSGLANQVVT